MGDSKQLTILQMNDSHAYLGLHPEVFIENGVEKYRNVGGYARIARIFNQVRQENPHGVLALDNGDTFHGTYPAVTSQGEALVPIMNQLGFDGMTGHWEFAYGPNQFNKLVSMLDYPMLAANIYHQDTNDRVFPAHIIVERAGLRIGVIGIAEHIVDKMMPAYFSEGTYFTLGNEELPGIIDQLRNQDKVDLVIVLSHFGFPQEAKLVSEVDGIDILLSGHTHNRLEKPVMINDTILMQSGCHGSFVGRLDLTFANGEIQHFKHQLIEVKEELTPDPIVENMVNSIMKPDRKMLDHVVGYTDIALNRNLQLETTMDNLLLEALLDASGTEIAFSNGWRYGAAIPSGKIRVNDLWNIIPTNPPVSIVELSGKEIMMMLEENLEHTFASDPYKQMGGYLKRSLGITMFVKLENPNGMRIQRLFIGDELVDENKSYPVSFVTVQGVPKKYGSNRRNLEIHAIDALRQYIEKNGTVSPKLRDTVKLV